MQNSSVDLRRLSARDTVAGDPASSVQGINTFNLPDGAIVWCSETKQDYQLDRSSTQTGGGAVAPSAGPGRWFPVSAQSPAYIMQAAWYIDSVNGNDANTGDAANAALKTLAELTRRTEGRVLSSSISLFTVHLSGSFPTEPLVLNFSVSAYCWVQVTADTQVDYTGSVTGFTTYSAGVTAALLDDAAAAFVAGDQQKRVRLTSGAGNGACAFVLKTISGTQIRVSEFYTQGTTGYGAPALTATPANGTTFVVETLSCQVGGLDVVIDGGLAAVLIRDVTFVRSSSSLTRATARLWSSAIATSSKIFGCAFDNVSSNLGITNSVCSLISTCTRDNFGVLVISDSTVIGYGLVLFGAITLQAQASLQMTGGLTQQGLTAARGYVFVGRNAVLTSSSTWGAFDLSGLDAALSVEDAAYVQVTGATPYWGIGTGQTYGIRCRGKGTMDYVTRPTVSGGTADTIIGGTATAYGAVPFVNPANNCAITLRA